MFKILFFCFIYSINLFADYQVFVNKSQPFNNDNVSTKEVIFFEELQEYSKSLEEIQKNIAAKGVVGAANGLSNQSANLAKGLAGEGLKAGASGLGIGLVFSALDPYVMSFYADQLYVQVYTVKLNDGRTVYMNKFFVGDKHPSLSDKEIQKILGGKK